MAARKIIAPEILAKAKRLYEQTLAPVNDIAAMMGISRPTFYQYVRDENWVHRRASTAEFEFARALITASDAEQSHAPQVAPPAPVRDVPPPSPRSKPPPDRTVLAERLLELVAQEMSAIEAVLKAFTPGDAAEADRSARTLGNLGRSLHEIAALLKPDRVTVTDETDDDPVPCDPDELRTELARRINALIDARQERESGSSGGVVGPVSSA